MRLRPAAVKRAGVRLDEECIIEMDSSLSCQHVERGSADGCRYCPVLPVGYTDSLIKIYTRYYELYKKSMNKATGILKNFVPTNYDGDILLFYTEENEINSKSLGWESICSGNILCKPVKGNHNTMMLIPNVLSITESINKL